MKVIMNADDFGFSKGVNWAILEGFQQGILTSTSLMVNMPGFDHAVSLMKQYPDLLHVGIHLVTTAQYSIVKGLKTLNWWKWSFLSWSTDHWKEWSKWTWFGISGSNG